ENVGGEIYLTGGSGRVISSGDVSVVGIDGAGGEVRMLGDQVGLFGDAMIDASGSDGGGVVLIGGDFQGKGELKTADATYIGVDTRIDADAVEQGNGGKVIVWANGATRYYGDISAQGGAVSGDGGFVEVSGKQWLDFNGRVNTNAGNGETGTLLLDPTDITIQIGGSPPPALDPDGTDPDMTFSLDTGGSAIIQVSVLEGALVGANVEVITASSSGVATLGGQITVNDPVSWSSGRKLTFTAESNVDINAAITATGSGSFTSTGVDFDNTGGKITTEGGAVDIYHTGAITIGADIDTSGIGGIDSPTAGGAVTITTAAGTINTAAASIITTGGNDGSGPGDAEDGGAVIITGTGGAMTIGNLTTTGGSEGAGPNNGGKGGDITLTQNSSGQTLTVEGNVDASGGAAVSGTPGSAGILTIDNAGAASQ
ncbi:MAG: hypothetical protein GY934_14245, partial [Gammaproteobacteria bacterium]|nr:hypothetical protein [Gammaproteobacteria bacterium]